MASTPHHTWLDIWRVHTWAVANETVPFCSEYQDCQRFMRSFILTSSKQMETTLTARIWCTTHVDVPDYYFNATTHGLASRHVSLNDQGNLMFTKGVCTCDIAAGRAGEDCSRTSLGRIYGALSVVVLLWIVYLFFGTVLTMTRGHLKSASKKKLAYFALVQYLSQVVWITGMSIFPETGQQASIREARVGLGFIATTVSYFLFMCGITVSINNFVRQGCNESNIKRRLKFLAGVFRVVPLIMGVIAGTLFFTYNSSTPVVLVILFSSTSIFVFMNYWYCINVLDLRVLRLLPRQVVRLNSKPARKKNRILCCSVSCLHGKNIRPLLRASKVHSLVTQNQEAAALLRTSRRLQDMSSSQRRCLLVNVFCGFLYGVSVFSTNAAFDHLDAFVFLTWQVALAVLPMVGLGGLSALSPAKTARKLIASRPEVIGTNDMEDVVYSTDVGTLGS